MLLDALAERYRLRLRQHGDATARFVLVIFQSYSRKLFVPLAAKRIIVANHAAGTLAHQYLTTARYVTGLPAAALPAIVRDDGERIAQALSTALELGPGSLERLGRSEPLSAAQTALSDALEVTGQAWVRHTGPNACPTCMRLADGRPRAPDVRMAVAHPSCSCVQRFVEEEPWQPRARRRTRKAPSPKTATRTA